MPKKTSRLPLPLSPTATDARNSSNRRSQRARAVVAAPMRSAGECSQEVPRKPTDAPDDDEDDDDEDEEDVYVAGDGDLVKDEECGAGDGSRER